ncbi:MAG: hypothetical protein JWN46_2854 [Acidimicrobiales bacterium]|nr:hypothetical protein [Acidimicrobiales bacterium]
MRWLAPLAALTLLLAACGSSKKSSSTTTSSSGGSVTTAGSSGGSANKATGSPITIGFINQEGDPTASYEDWHSGADAAIGYINNELGGIGGHPIAYKFCATKAAAGGDTCANQMVDAKVPMVMGGYVFNTGPMLPLLKSAAIPYISGAGLISADFASDGNHYFLHGGSLGTFLGVVSYLKSSGIKSLAILHSDAPPGVLAAQVVQKGLANVKTQLVPIPATSADMTPIVSSISGQPDAVLLLQGAPLCGSVMKTIADLGYKAQVIVTPGCVAQDVVKVAGKGAEGVMYLSSTTPFSATTDPDIKLLNDSLAKYTSKQPSARAVEGFALVLAIRDIITKAGGASATAATINTTVKNSKNVKQRLAGPYSCNPPPLAKTPAVCNDSVEIWQLKGGASSPVAGGKIFHGADAAG